ncbi:non-lysosomal glucosylceramidase-like [Ylistrum balloti]|uniref:non-lysosomal glucosylceramidase-like n=1 Tax=Ylistrum balloti TaxID=509963 RepID=UPI002905EBA2|nr:non-lysosomal glucosylceramidase-like [Ylistrum balloti]
MATYPKNPQDSETTPKENIPGVPDYGWRVKLDYECKTKCTPFTKPRLSQIPSLIGLSLRYMKVWVKTRRQGRRLFIDHLDQVEHKSMYGCPLGGIGCGTVGRGFRGEFCRFQMLPGLYEHQTVQANQFILCIRKNGKTVYQKVLTGRKGKHLKAWEWGFPAANATYHALYPRAWTVYDIPEYKLRLVCRQISPVFPHDYKETSFPMGVFAWSVENNGSEPLDVSIVFTFKNGTGSKTDSVGECQNEAFESDAEGTQVTGVLIRHSLRDIKCTYGIAAANKEDVHVSHKLHFDPKGNGRVLWDDLAEDGQLNSTPENQSRGRDSVPKTVITLFFLLLVRLVRALANLILPPASPDKPQRKGQESAVAVCSQVTVPPSSKKEMDFTLTWDMPVVHFKNKEKLYGRRYGRWFGYKNDACPRMCSYALQHYSSWEQKIEAWQNPILQNSNLPAWYKSALFNELYYVSDGGTIWADPLERKDGELCISKDPSEAAVIQEYSKFAYLEGHEYRMYNTYDVHHYASFSLIMLWPKIQLSLQYDIAKAVMSEDATPIQFCMEGMRGIKKKGNSVPHDIGDPEDEPWTCLNAYIIHPTCEWKDLNLKFVLQTYRDFSITKDEEYLRNMYPVAKTVMEIAEKWDTDGDGLIENSGFADQTFDAWSMTGASAYCGGMWLATLRMMIEMGKVLGNEEDVKKYTEILDKGKVSFEAKVWNGKYYNYDSNPSGGHHDSIMSDQLAGQWFLTASGLADTSIFPEDHVQSALETVYKFNVKGFGNGNMGAINGARPDGGQDITSCQSEEFWVGVTYSLGANMIQQGMVEEGFQTAWGAYHVCWEWYGLAFQTPEAYMMDKHYRSLGYMRPLAIWSMQWALEKFQPQLMSS